MKIEGDGFLSEAGQEKALQLCAAHEQVFRALEYSISKVRTFVSSQEVCEQDSDEDRQKIIALVLAARVLEISEAALLVMKNGMSNEANTLFRVFLDAYFVIGNVCSDASFVADYLKSDEAARLKLLNVVKKHDSSLFMAINEYATEALRDELQKKISEEKIQAFNSYAYADNIRCSEIYDSMYRIVSASLHTTPRALEKYVEGDNGSNVVLIKDYPIKGDIPQRAYDLSYFLIKVLSGLKEVFDCLDEEEIQTLINHLNETAEIET